MGAIQAMVNLKSASQNSAPTPTVNRRKFNFRQLWLFILASILVHGLGLIAFVLYQSSLLVKKEETESKPIEFVVVPEESEVKPPPKTQKRANENSVAEKTSETEKTIVDEETSDDIAPTAAPLSKDPSPSPKIAPPPPAPKPIARSEPVSKPEPAPEPAPEPEQISQSKPESSEPETDASSPVLSGSDPAVVPEPKPKPKAAQSEPVATRLSPEPELPTTKAPPAQQPENSASSLLGGDYKRTLANGGGDAFFSPEALSFNSVLNPAQLNALKDIDLSEYIAEIERKVRPNWNPTYRVEDRTTVLTFNIQKDGRVTGLRVARSSGLAEVDRESLTAVQNSVPFAPLPPEFPLESLEITFSFNIHIY